MPTPTKWRKPQRQAFIDEHGLVDGLLLFITGKKNAANARWKAFYRDRLKAQAEAEPTIVSKGK